jgi:hypothetical protein
LNRMHGARLEIKRLRDKLNERALDAPHAAVVPLHGDL